ncbi:PIF1 family ATP-dependent DNA helicase [Sessilibacter corallicola]|uniref:UvrD-like helicase C-terminal domain-containing protein n=1 Tax=Sessilibacter corallicola TaxID=2904075 RepID=A0ABQ0A6M5_9GAMM
MLDESQIIAYKAVISAVKSNQFDKHIVIQGAAGTGKSLLLKSVALNLITEGYLVTATAYTNRATNKLRDALDEPCQVTTTGKLFGFTIDEYGHINIRGSRPKFKKGQIVLIDECGMLEANVAQFIVEIANACGCLLVMAGDPYQIPCIKNNKYIESTIFSDKSINQIFLEKCYRQIAEDKEGLFGLVDAIRKSIDGKVFPDLEQYKNVKKLPSKSFIDSASEMFKNKDSVKIISLVGSTKADNHIDGLNRHVKEKVLPSSSQSAFQIGESLITIADMKADDGSYISKDTDFFVDSVSKVKSSSVGLKVNEYVCQSLVDNRKVTFTAALNVQEVVTMQRELNKKLEQARNKNNTLEINEIRKRINDCTRFAAPVISAYAVSVFSAQGSEYDHVFLDLNKINRKLDKMILLRMLYVAVSRARKSLTFSGGADLLEYLGRATSD